MGFDGTFIGIKNGIPVKIRCFNYMGNSVLNAAVSCLALVNGNDNEKLAVFEVEKENYKQMISHLDYDLKEHPDAIQLNEFDCETSWFLFG